VRLNNAFIGPKQLRKRVQGIGNLIINILLINERLGYNPSPSTRPIHKIWSGFWTPIPNAWSQDGRRAGYNLPK